MESRVDYGFDFETIEGAMTEAGVAVSRSGVHDTGFDPAAEEREGGEGIGVLELDQLVAILETEPAGPSLDARGPVQLERASIFLHQAWELEPSDHGRVSSRSMSRRLEAAFVGVDPSTVSAYLLEAMSDVAPTAPAENFDAWMDIAGSMFRRAVPMLVDRMIELATALGGETAETLWPHIVDGFLLSLGTRPRELDRALFDLPEDTLDRGYARLGKLRAFGTSLFKPGSFKLDQAFAYPTMLALMESPLHASVGPVLLAAFRDTMPTDPGVRACMLAFRSYNDSVGWVLARQLAAGCEPIDVASERLVAWFLLGAFQGLDPERRGEPWIPEAFEWLGARDRSQDTLEQFEETNALFDAVTGERQGHFRKAWSKACRRSAAWAKDQGGQA